MFTYSRIICSCAFLLLAISLSACVTNTVSTSWIDQSFKGPIKGRILVVGIFKEATTHKIYEDSFVETLIKAGADAVPSYPYGKEDERHRKEWLQQAVRQSGASYVLLTHLTDSKKQVYTVDPHGLILGGGSYEDGIDGYQSYVVEVTLEQGDTLTRTEDYIAATLFDYQSDTKIWSATTESVNLNRYLRADDEKLDNILIRDMMRHHIL